MSECWTRGRARTHRRAADELRRSPRSKLRWPGSARTLEFAVHGPIARSDLPGLCDRVCALLAASDAEIALCDVRGVEPDAVTVDALARLQLAARRHRCSVSAPERVARAHRARGVHGPRRRAASTSKARRQAEQREHAIGVEEERELDDRPVLDLDHLERPRVEPAPGLARLVLPERRRAVRRRAPG